MLLWALLGCSATFAVSIVSERSLGTLQRLRAAPLPRGAILAGKALACFLACLLAAGVLTVLAALTSQVTLEAPGKWALVLVAISLCFTGITMLLGSLGRTEQAVAGAGWAVLLVLAMLGGAMVPLAFLPEWLSGASQLSPVRWSMLALEGVLLRDFSLRELSMTLVALVSTGLASLALGGYALSRQRG
jgi:ABC-2 type transport system permease protein